MFKKLQKAAFVLALLTLSAPAIAGDIVREFRGTGNTTTGSFIVKSPWLLDWRLDGDYEALIALDVRLIDVRTGLYADRVLHVEHRGNGLRLFMEGGEYKLRVSSSLARWTIKIEQIKPEEAKLYTPRKKS